MSYGREKDMAERIILRMKSHLKSLSSNFQGFAQRNYLYNVSKMRDLREKNGIGVIGLWMPQFKAQYGMEVCTKYNCL